MTKKREKVEPLSLLAQILHFWSILATFRLNLSCSNQIEELFFHSAILCALFFPFPLLKGKFSSSLLFSFYLFSQEREKTQRWKKTQLEVRSKPNDDMKVKNLKNGIGDNKVSFFPYKVPKIRVESICINLAFYKGNLQNNVVCHYLQQPPTISPWI